MLLTMQGYGLDLLSKPECQKSRVENESTEGYKKVKFIRLERCLRRKLLDPMAVCERSQRMGAITSTRVNRGQTRVAVGELMW